MKRSKAEPLAPDVLAFAAAHKMSTSTAGDRLAVHLRMAVDRYNTETAAERSVAAATWAGLHRTRPRDVMSYWITWRRAATYRGKT